MVIIYKKNSSERKVGMVPITAHDEWFEDHLALLQPGDGGRSIDGVRLIDGIRLIIAEIDGAELLDRETVRNRFGDTVQITKLSRGAKAALNVYLNPDVLFDVSGCSGRVIERICTFSRGRIMVEVYGGNTYAGNSVGKSRARVVTGTTWRICESAQEAFDYLSWYDRAWRNYLTMSRYISEWYLSKHALSNYWGVFDTDFITYDEFRSAAMGRHYLYRRARCVSPHEAGEKYWLYRLSEEVCGDEEISAEIPLAEEVQAARLEHNPCEDRILRRKYEKELSRRRRAEAGNDANGADGIKGVVGHGITHIPTRSEIVDSLRNLELPGNIRIGIHGSYARGDYRRCSDINIVYQSHEKDNSAALGRVVGTLQKEFCKAVTLSDYYIEERELKLYKMQEEIIWINTL